MATSIGQYTPVFLPGETPSLTEKPGRPQSTGSQRVSQDRSEPAFINTRLFFSFACGSSVPVRVEHEGGAAAWLAGGANCSGPQTTFMAGVMALSESFFESVVAGNQKTSLASLSCSSVSSGTERDPLPGVLLCCSTCQAHRGALLTGVLLCRLAHQSLKGAP